ncbi:MAG TPA: PAS domain S-box protein, partial [Thermoanaerobaculia bacterium]|nr:PAS domain S-box protein [Thermoanaerobaculia bacterium]
MSDPPVETLLDDAQQQYEQLVASIDGIVWELDTRTSLFTFVSQQAERLLGYPLEQWFTPGFWADHLHPEDREWAVEFCLRATCEKRNHDFEYRMLAADGRTVWLRDIVTVVEEGGGAVKLRGIMVDVTERKGVEEDLLLHAERLQLLYSANLALAQTLDLEALLERLIEVMGQLIPHDGASIMLLGEDGLLRVRAARGYQSEADPKLATGEPFAPEAFSLIDRVLKEKTGVVIRDTREEPAWIVVRGAEHARNWLGVPLLASGAAIGLYSMDKAEPGFFTEEHRRLAEALAVPAAVAIQNARLHQQAQAHARELEERVADHKRAEDALRLFRSLIDHTNDAIEVVDPETGRFLDVNEKACLAHGYTREEFLALTVPEVDPQIAERPWHEIREERQRHGSQVFESQHRRKDGSVFPVEVNVNYIRLDRDYQLAVVRDITERKRAEQDLNRLEEQFRQAQKMEAVGRLAGGVAHDFNNLLTVINGYTELVFSRLPANDPSRELLAEVQKSGERAAKLTRQLLAFSRQQLLQPEVVSLNMLLDELRKLLRPLIGDDIELALISDPGLGLAKVDPGQFEQAIINLAVNARDAMPQGGRLIIETRNAELAEADAERRPDVRPGQYVLVMVSDSGQGMDEATRARIFEPFFTTKGPAKGTGLGLAMVYGFVKQSGGHIEVYSEPGHG